MKIEYSSVDMNAIMQRCYDAMDDIQRRAVAHARSYRYTIFDIWLGVGKTFISLTSGFTVQPQRWLILCSKNAVPTWRNEIKKWFPEFGADNLFTHVRGQPQEREALWKNPSLFYITTPGSFIRDVETIMRLKMKFNVISIDEPHRYGLRNRKSVMFNKLKMLTNPNYHKVSMITMSSATVTSKGVPQLWPYLHILERKKFSSYWQFVDRYCVVVNDGFGRDIRGPKNAAGLAALVAPYIFKIDKKQAQALLPPMRRQKLYTSLTPQLKAMHRSMAEELFMMTEEELIAVPNPISAYLKMRQLVCCPAIIDPSLGPGVAIEVVADKILDMQEEPNWLHNIIFTPFVPSIPIFKDYLIEVLGIKEKQVLTLQGGVETEYLAGVEENFRKDPNTLLISSLKYAQAWNAETCRHVFFPHFEWDQDDNEQAEGRARRRTSDMDHMIMSYYVSIEGSITESMFDILNSKVKMNNMTYSGFEPYRKMINNRLKESLG